MDMNANRGGPDDHNCGSYCAPDDLPPPYPHNEEQSNQPQYDEQPLRLPIDLKRKRQENQPIIEDTQHPSQERASKTRKYSVGIEDWHTASIVCNMTISDDDLRLSTSFANPQTRYPPPCATYPNPEQTHEGIEQYEPIASTSADLSYLRASPSRPPEPVVAEETRPPLEALSQYQGSKISMFKTRWLRRRLEETLPQNTLFQPIPSTSRQSISPGPQPDTVNVSTQVEFGELGNITYEDQMEEQIENLKCLLCQATNYCRKKCSMRGKRAHGMWCLHGIQLGNNSRSPEPDTSDTLNLSVDQNRNYSSDIFASDVYIHSSLEFSLPGTSSQVTQLPETHHDPVLYDDPNE